MKKKVELLAPAGSYEALEAAVFNGADAVYLSGKRFGARKYAQNFDKEALCKAVSFCHQYGVSVHVTVNTLLVDKEFSDFFEELDFLYTIGVDALIVQDFGAFFQIKNRYPDWEIHSSTQMTAHSLADCLFLEDMGFHRVVLSRELSLEDIRYIHKYTNVCLESFVHGALCVSYSGQCLFSSLIGGRSGNRGSCAQSCRKIYEITKKIENDEYASTTSGEGYFLSPKDFSAIAYIPQLIEAGVKSFKIEGRMKRPEYVATVVNAYRQAIDAHMENKLFDWKLARHKTAAVFNRGFTDGYLDNWTNESIINPDFNGHMGEEIGKVSKWDGIKKRLFFQLEKDIHVGDEIQIRRKGKTLGARVEFIEIKGSRVQKAKKGQNVGVNMRQKLYPGEVIYRTIDDVLMKAARESYERCAQMIPINMEMEMEKEKPIKLKMWDSNENVVEVCGITPEIARKKGLTGKRLEEQMKKLGGTAYFCKTFSYLADPDLTVSIKELNALRRKGVEALNEKRMHRYPKRKAFSKKKVNETTWNKVENLGMKKEKNDGEPICLHIVIKELCQLEKVNLEPQDKIFIKNIDSLIFLANKMPQLKKQIVFDPGPIVKKKLYMDMEKFESKLRSISGLWAQSYGMIKWAKEKRIPLLGVGQGLNVANTYSLRAHLRHAACVGLSQELNLSQILKINGGNLKETEATVYGRQTLMSMETNPLYAPRQRETLLKDKVFWPEPEVKYGLKDKTGAVFPICVQEKETTQILNSKILCVPQVMEVLMNQGMNHFRILLTQESAEEAQQVFSLFQSVRRKEKNSLFDGLLSKEKNHFTRGHFYRGGLLE